jgi:hypothetical protein
MISEIAKTAGEVAKKIAETLTSPTSGVESGPGKFEVPGTRDLGQTDGGPTGFDAKGIGKLSDIKADMMSGMDGADSVAEKAKDASKISDANEMVKLPTRNEGLEGQRYPGTDVLFERVTVTLPDGRKVEGVFAKFESTFDTTLTKNADGSYVADYAKNCNAKLKEAVTNDPELAKKFSKEQLEQIKNEETPDGYVWHHNQEPGKMQLVDEKTHTKVGHTGGNSIWGGKQPWTN